MRRLARGVSGRGRMRGGEGAGRGGGKGNHEGCPYGGVNQPCDVGGTALQKNRAKRSPPGVHHLGRNAFFTPAGTVEYNAPNLVCREVVMLDDLQDTIEILKKRIRDHKDHIQDYESRTRTTLIDPMLQVLGWDVSDPAVVQIEPKTVTGWADYALLGSNGKPIVFVEAKKLDQRDVPIGQIIRDAGTENYQNQANITYCLYTNGDVWEVINVREQDRVVRVSIATEDTSDCAMKLVSLWRASLVDGRFRRAEAPVIVDESETCAAASSARPDATTSRLDTTDSRICDCGQSGPDDG